jgi:putative transposase
VNQRETKHPGIVGPQETLLSRRHEVSLLPASQRAAQRPDAGLIHHSDRGVQYASAEYRKMMQSAGLRASMSRKADCYDNAPMESFFHTLKTELVHHRHYATREEARRDIFTYIEGFYNRTRRHSAIGYTSPIEMELKAA